MTHEPVTHGRVLRGRVLSGRVLSGRVYGLLLVITVCYLVALAVVTLRPEQRPAPETGVLWGLVHLLRDLFRAGALPFNGVEFAANIVLFAPFGLLGVLLLGSRRWWQVALAGLVTTVAIETAQRWIPGRYSDPRDVVANTLGTLVGIVCGRLVWAWSDRSGRRARPAEESAATSKEER